VLEGVLRENKVAEEVKKEEKTLREENAELRNASRRMEAC
jgi:hypothetical protein